VNQRDKKASAAGDGLARGETKEKKRLSLGFNDDNEGREGAKWEVMKKDRKKQGSGDRYKRWSVAQRME